MSISEILSSSFPKSNTGSVNLMSGINPCKQIFQINQYEDWLANSLILTQISSLMLGVLDTTLCDKVCQ